jgi:hypothetical protein
MVWARLGRIRPLITSRSNRPAPAPGDDEPEPTELAGHAAATPLSLGS